MGSTTQVIANSPTRSNSALHHECPVGSEQLFHLPAIDATVAKLCLESDVTTGTQVVNSPNVQHGPINSQQRELGFFLLRVAQTGETAVGLVL